MYLLFYLLILSSILASANWLLQCSTCVDQTYYGDAKLKSDARVVDNLKLLEAIKQVRVHEFTHVTEEHYNKFFNRTQLGILAQDLQEVMPEAVASIPERRYTDTLGASKVNKDVLLIRDSHLLFSAVGALNYLAHEVDGAEAILAEQGRKIEIVEEEQVINKRKREEFMEQLLRIVATQEVLSTALREADKRFSEVEIGFASLKEDTTAMTELQKKKQDHVESALQNVTEILKKEAHADLVQKTKRAEMDLEKVKTLKEIEELRYKEEQKTIRLRNKEKKETEEAILNLNKDRIKYEQEEKLRTDLQNIKATEASNLRQLAAKAKHEREIKGMEVEMGKHKAEMELQQAIESAKIEQEAKIRERRENEDIHAREARMKLEGQKQQVIVAIQATAKILMSYIQMLYGSTLNMMYGLGSFLSVMIGIYFTREMATLLREQLNKRLGRPSLVRVTSKKTRLGDLVSLFRSLLFCCGRRDGYEFDDVVLHKKLEQQILRLANATRNAKQRKMPLLHIMFYGPPGTGKTMCAQRFAKFSGLEYAFMSGADVAPLEDQAVTELHKLFTWVNKSRKGVLLFIDEADAFLKVRDKNMSETMRNAITTMLYHTGTETSQFLMVLATNRPGDLDPAVLDRIDESVEFGLPDLPEREKLVKQYFNLYVSKPLQIPLGGDNRIKDPAMVVQKKKDEDCDEATLMEVAKQLKTFSGREISKLFTGLQTHICAHMKGGLGGGFRAREKLRLTKGTILEVVHQKVEEHNRTMDVLAKGYQYVHREGSMSISTPERVGGTRNRDPLSLSKSESQYAFLQQANQNNQNINININNSGSQSPVKSREELYQGIYGCTGNAPLRGDSQSTLADLGKGEQFSPQNLPDEDIARHLDMHGKDLDHRGVPMCFNIGSPGSEGGSSGLGSPGLAFEGVGFVGMNTPNCTPSKDDGKPNLNPEEENRRKKAFVAEVDTKLKKVDDGHGTANGTGSKAKSGTKVVKRK